MINLLRQEIYKIIKKPSSKIVPIILFILMLVVAMMAKNQASKFYISSAFAGFQWSAIILIIVSASLISEEFQYGTIKKLIYSVNSRSIIYITKLIIVIGYDIYLHILSVLLTVILKIVIIGKSPSFSSEYLYNLPIWQNLLINTLIDLMGTLIIITAVFLIASITNTGSAAIAFGIGLCFLGQGISSFINRVATSSSGWSKWNPFNMLNITNQLANPSYKDITHLTVKQLVTGNLLYSLIFILFGILIFSKRRV